MNWTKLSVATTLVAALIASPATAYADPVPTPDEVVGVMAKLTDPGIPAANKADIVTPTFAPEEAGTTDDHLNSLNSRGYIPFNFVVTDIQRAPDNFAGATVAAPRDYPYYSIRPVPIVLISQSGRWSITHDAAMAFLNQMWSSTRHRAGFTAFRLLTATNAKLRA
jgi:hypothetical protein